MRRPPRARRSEDRSVAWVPCTLSCLVTQLPQHQALPHQPPSTVQAEVPFQRFLANSTAAPTCLDSWGCLNKTTNWQLRATELYSLPVWMPEVKNQGIGRVLLPRSFQERILPCNLQLVVAASIPRPSLAYRCVTAVSASVIPWPSLPCVCLSCYQ